MLKFCNAYLVMAADILAISWRIKSFNHSLSEILQPVNVSFPIRKVILITSIADMVLKNNN